MPCRGYTFNTFDNKPNHSILFTMAIDIWYVCYHIAIAEWYYGNFNDIPHLTIQICTKFLYFKFVFSLIKLQAKVCGWAYAKLLQSIKYKNIPQHWEVRRTFFECNVTVAPETNLNALLTMKWKYDASSCYQFSIL